MVFRPITAFKLLMRHMTHQEAARANFGFTHRVDAEAALSDVLCKLQE